MTPPTDARSPQPADAVTTPGHGAHTRRWQVALALGFVLALIVLPLTVPNTQGIFTASIRNSTSTAKVLPYFTCREALTQESGRYFASPFATDKPVNLVNSSNLPVTNVVGTNAASGCTHDTPGYLTFAGTSTAKGASTVVYQLPSGQKPPETYTQELWMKTTTAHGNLMAMTNNATYLSEDKQDRQLYLGTSGRLVMANYLAGGSQAGGFEQVVSPVSVTDGKWHHIIATRNPAAGLSSLYVDGKLAGSVPVAGTLDVGYSPQFWRVGCARSDGWPDAPAKTSECFAGDIAYAAAYNRAFTQQDVTNHYRAGTWGAKP